MAEGQTAIDVAPTVVVVGRQFSVSHAVNFTVTCTRGYKVKDINGDVVFKVKNFCFSSRCLLLDAASNPLLTIKPKSSCWHVTWKVFRGKSTSRNDLLFSVRQSKGNFDVLLAANTDKASPCDFKITGRSKNRIICIGESNDIIAQLHRKTPFFANGKVEVTVNPNVDQVFIISLIVILELIKEAASG